MVDSKSHQHQQKMVDSNNKPLVVVIGSLGNGKSTFLNTLLGKNRFVTSDKP